jgi:predicted alpha/beta superfamily hydrolase
MLRKNHSPITQLCVFLFLLSLFSVSGLAEEVKNKIVIGDSITLKSDILRENRLLMIYLPFGYERTNKRYPVLYLLDGNTHFLNAAAIVNFLSHNRHIPPMIVVAIPNTKRTRDFTPTKDKERTGSSGADKFIIFLKNELFPFIENEYRTVPYRVLFGHSLTGMFAIYTLFTDPTMFQAYIAVSPGLDYINRYVLSLIEKKKEFPDISAKTLFITYGNERYYSADLNKFINLLETHAPPTFEWGFKIMPEYNHQTVPLESLYRGLETIYSGFRLPENLAEGGVKAIKAHYEKIKKKYLYDLPYSEVTINGLGYQMAEKKNYDKAIEIFTFNVELFPDSANVYDSLGEAYMQSGQLELAKKNFEIAIENGKKTKDQNLKAYKEHLDIVTKELLKESK